MYTEASGSVVSVVLSIWENRLWSQQNIVVLLIVSKYTYTWENYLLLLWQEV